MWYAKLLVFALLSHGVALGQARLNMSMVKNEARIFEYAVTEVIRQNFNHPFALESDPLSSYVQGYGMVVAFQLHINRARIRTPYGELLGRSAEKAGAASKLSREEQVDLVRGKLIECLADYGDALKQLSASDNVSISAHIEDRSELDRDKTKTVLVVTASKDDIMLAALRRITPQEFSKRVHVLRY